MAQLKREKKNIEECNRKRFEANKAAVCTAVEAIRLATEKGYKEPDYIEELKKIVLTENKDVKDAARHFIWKHFSKSEKKSFIQYCILIR